MRFLKRFLRWRVTVTIQPALVLALITGDIALRLMPLGFARRALPIVSVASGVLLALLVLLFVYCVTNGRRH